MHVNRRFTALAVARAMLAGPPSECGLRARMHACLGAQSAWCAPIAHRCSRLPGELWRRMTIRSLATLIERDANFEAAWLASDRPKVRRYILRVAEGMQRLPLGLEGCQVPAWPHTGALAQWLGVSNEGMWRLTRNPSWQRRLGLADQHYGFRLVAKRSGGWRLLEVPHPYLKSLQRRVLDDLLDRVPPHQAACGFRREQSVVDHARAHVGQAVVLKFDLQDFFTTVRASRVHALFTTLGYSESVARELTALCTVATPEPVLRRLHRSGGLQWMQLLRLREPHLPQGAPTSAALANLCAFRLDLRLQGLADSLGARYTRYADDLVLSGDVALRDAAPRVEAWVARIATEEGFALNHRKTRRLPMGRRQTVCGVVVNARPNLQRKDFDVLKAILHRCVRNGPDAENREGLADWRGHLQGRIAWARQLNADKAARLQHLFDLIHWPR